MRINRSSELRSSKESLALAAALIGCPSRNAEAWLESETLRRVTEAKALGADDARASEWASVWHRLARRLIEASRR